MDFFKRIYHIYDMILMNHIKSISHDDIKIEKDEISIIQVEIGNKIKVTLKIIWRFHFQYSGLLICHD